MNTRSTAASDYQYSDFRYVINQWLPLGANNRSKWEAFAANWPRKNRLGQPMTATAFDWFMALNLSAKKYHGSIQLFPPNSPTIQYHPAISIEYTASGFEINFDATLPFGMNLAVKQLRTQRPTPLAHGTLQLSHTFGPGTVSPQLISAACGGAGGPGSLPPINCGTWVQFEAFVIDENGRQTPRLFYNRLASI